MKTMILHFVTCGITIALATFWALDKPGPMCHNIFHNLNAKDIFFERSKLMFIKSKLRGFQSFVES